MAREWCSSREGTARDYRDLAQALSRQHTVPTPDRRGRATSPRPYDPAHEIARDVEDVDAVLTGTGADRVFGLSSGAVIALEAARTLTRVTRAAVYEPPFFREGIAHDGIRRLGADAPHLGQRRSSVSAAAGARSRAGRWRRRAGRRAGHLGGAAVWTPGPSPRR